MGDSDSVPDGDRTHVQRQTAGIHPPVRHARRVDGRRPDPCLDSDTVFAVKNSLICTFQRHDARDEDAERFELEPPFCTAEFDFVLKPSLECRANSLFPHENAVPKQAGAGPTQAGYARQARPRLGSVVCKPEQPSDRTLRYHHRPRRVNVRRNPKGARDEFSGFADYPFAAVRRRRFLRRWPESRGESWRGYSAHSAHLVVDRQTLGGSRAGGAPDRPQPDPSVRLRLPAERPAQNRGRRQGVS